MIDNIKELHDKAIKEIMKKGVECVDWSTIYYAADFVKKDENFITVFIDGMGIATKAINNDDWAFIHIGDNTYMGVTLSKEYYNELKEG